jgi:hypothetical protein
VYYASFLIDLRLYESLEKILVMKFVMLFSLLTLDSIDEVCYAFFLIDLRLYLREAFGE